MTLAPELKFTEVSCDRQIVTGELQQNKIVIMDMYKLDVIIKEDCYNFIGSLL